MSTAPSFCARALSETHSQDHFTTLKTFALTKVVIGLFVLFTLLVSSCAKDPEGALTVGVYFDDGKPAEGATVTLSPGKLTAVTDAKGAAEFNSIEAITYRVEADFRGLTGGSSVLVIESQTARLLVQLSGNVASVEPAAIELTAPLAAETHFTRSTLRLRGKVTVAGEPVTFAPMTWGVPAAGRSGVASTQSDGGFGFELSFDEPGTYAGFIEIKTDFPTATRFPFTLMVVPLPLLTLDLQVVEGKSVVLNWSQYRGERPFTEYTIYRNVVGCDPSAINDWTPIYTARSQSTLSYVDTSATPVARKVCYFVSMGYGSREDGHKSNAASYEPTDIKWLGFVPSQVAAHPTNARLIYATDSRKSRVVLYDVTTGRESASVQMSGTLADIALADAGRGLELFVASSGGYVAALDPNTLQERLRIATTEGAYAVAAFEEGYILVSDDRTTGNASTYRTYRRSDGSLIARSSTKTRPSKLLRIPGQRAAIAARNSSGLGAAQFIRLDAAGGIAEEVTYANPGAAPVGAQPFTMSPDGSFWVSSYAGSCFRANEAMEYRGALEQSGLGLSQIAISKDGTAVYSGQSRLDVIERYVSYLVTNEYPSRLLRRTQRLRSLVAHICVLADGSVLTVQLPAQSRHGIAEVSDAAVFIIQP